MRRLWNLIVKGRISGAVGWCGSDGYWWVKPCPHYRHESWGCGWYSGNLARVVSFDEAVKREEP